MQRQTQAAPRQGDGSRYFFWILREVQLTESMVEAAASEWLTTIGWQVAAGGVSAIEWVVALGEMAGHAECGGGSAVAAGAGMHVGRVDVVQVESLVAAAVSRSWWMRV